MRSSTRLPFFSRNRSWRRSERGASCSEHQPRFPLAHELPIHSGPDDRPPDHRKAEREDRLSVSVTCTPSGTCYGDGADRQA